MCSCPLYLAVFQKASFKPAELNVSAGLTVVERSPVATDTLATPPFSATREQVGSDFWMAPEVHSNRRATKASDVFSLHVVMWEVGEPLASSTMQALPTGVFPPRR